MSTTKAQDNKTNVNKRNKKNIPAKKQITEYIKNEIIENKK